MEAFQWTTTHNTAMKTISHVFEHNRIMVLTDLKSGQSCVQKDGEPLYSVDVSDWSLEEYTCGLQRLAIEDARLSLFAKVG